VLANIPRFTSRKKLSPEALKEFRSLVSQAKRKGLIRSGISAKTARPSFISGGKTLAEILNKNSERLKPYIHPPIRTKLLDKPIAVRDLPIKRKSLAAFFNELERKPELAADINAMKRPGERFGFTIDGTRSITTFPNIEFLVDHFKYEGKRAQFDIYHKHQKSVNLFNKIKLVRWKDGTPEWRRGAEKITIKQRAAKKAKGRRKK